MRYRTIQDGEKIWPYRRGYRLACCDCALVHRINFYLEPYGRGQRIVFRIWRDERATAACRRRKKT